MDLWSAVILLLLVMDPLGNVPLFLAATRSVEGRRAAIVIARECLIALVLLALVLLFGQQALLLLGLSGPALGIAGGAVLFLLSLKMVFPHRGEDPFDDPELGGEPPLIVPLAVPLIAGPGTIATLVLLGSHEPDARGRWFAALFIAWAASTVILLAAPLLKRLLKRRGLIALERLSGMALSAISVQMILSGIEAWWRALQ